MLGVKMHVKFEKLFPEIVFDEWFWPIVFSVKFVCDQLFLVTKLNFSVTKNTKLEKLLRKDFTNLTSVFLSI